MSRLSDAIPRDKFHVLPRPDTASGRPRRVGVEIEMAGLTETELARIASHELGGRVVDVAPYETAVDGSALGRISCFLDTKYRKGKHHALSRLGLQLGREVIPVELTTEPLAPASLPSLERLRERLQAAGASGSREGVFFGFGVHLNIEIAAEDVAAWRPVMTAFALVEDWLRLADPIDGARRLLPFVDPYPRAFVRRLLDLRAEAGAEQVIDLYLAETPTRNRGLDMLPLFARLDPGRLDRAGIDPGTLGARPAYHYRLPDSRIDEAEWRLAYEWNRWALVERIAARPALMDTLARRWEGGERFRHAWSDEVEQILGEADILGRPA